MDKLFAISIVSLFSLLILNITIIVKKDIEQTKKKELNQKIENSIIQPNNFIKEDKNTNREKKVLHNLRKKRIWFA